MRMALPSMHKCHRIFVTMRKRSYNVSSMQQQGSETYSERVEIKECGRPLPFVHKPSGIASQNSYYGAPEAGIVRLNVTVCKVLKESLK
jgi:hypothetical protein